MRGVVKQFNVDKGWGFIAPDDGSGDLFVHIKNCASFEGVKVGSRVKFDVEPSKKISGKFEAVNVVGLEPANDARGRHF
jgi:cold shock protein